jgi:uncharacterized membrane protein YhaH (DUF805 family)
MGLCQDRVMVPFREPSPSHSGAGCLAPGPFSLAVLAVYAVSLGSQLLVPPTLIGVAGFTVYALFQAALLVGWVMLHVRRLRDAGRPVKWAAAVGAIYAIEVVIVVVLMGMLASQPPGRDGVGPDASILQVFVIVSMLSGDASLAALQRWLIGFVIALSLPVIVAIGFSLWTATRPTLADRP